MAGQPPSREPPTEPCAFPAVLQDLTCDGILYAGGGAAQPRFQRKPPHLDHAREYRASGSYAKARAAIAALTEGHQRQQVAGEEEDDRRRAADKFVAAFAETRLGTCGPPTLNTKSVLIDRQRRKADKRATAAAVNAGGPEAAHGVATSAQGNDVKQRRAEAAAAARSAKVEAAIRRAYGSQVLDLKALELIRIPAQVSGSMLRQLARLIRTVNVSRNALRELPPEFCLAFPEAETLVYKENALDELPGEMASLAFLRHLSVECNQLVALPARLPKTLEVVHASRNRLQRVSNLHELTRLVELDLSYNLLQLLPSGIAALGKLAHLKLAGNRLMTLATLPRMTAAMLDADGGSSGDTTDGTAIDGGRDGDKGDPEEEKKQWRVEVDPETNSAVYFHLPTKQVTRVKPKCFRVAIPTLRLPTSADPSAASLGPKAEESDAQLLKRFPEGWEIVLPDATSTQIQYLNHCSGDVFSELPVALDRLGDLAHLHTLDVSNNQLQELPPSVGNLVRLKRLEAENNRLLRLPDAFHGLQALHTLRLGMNALSDLPPSISRLSSLADLDLKLNRLQTLPPAFGDLPHLETVDLSSNTLEALPSSFLRLRRLKSLKLHSNAPLTRAAGGFTAEVLASGDIPRIMWHLQHQLQCEVNGSQPPLPVSRVVGVGDEVWTTDIHVNREFARAIQAAQTSLCLDFHWKRLTLAEFPPAFFSSLSQLRELRLSGHCLETIPAAFSGLAALRVLQLRKNGIRSIDNAAFAPPDGRASCLEEMDLEHNHLAALPPSLGSLRRLRVLRVANNQLTDLPQELSLLSESLRELYVAHNRLSEAPHALGGLAALELLDVSNNQLQTLDTMAFGALTRLRTIRASANRLSALPAALGEVAPLEELSIAGNLFAELPPAVLRLGATLRRLEMQSNKIARLPLEFGDAMVTLERVASDGNPFLSPPAEIMRVGVGAVRAYLRKRQQRVAEISRLLETLALPFSPDAFLSPRLHGLLVGVGHSDGAPANESSSPSSLPTVPALPFLRAEHLAAFDRAVDRYVNGAFYLRADVRGADLVNDLLLRTHFSLAQQHHRAVLDDLVRLCGLVRAKKWADKVSFRYDLARPWGRRGELVDVFSVDPDALFEDQPRLPSVLSVVRVRVRHGFEHEAFGRSRREVEAALEQYVGVYGPVGVAHDAVPFHCGCEELLRFNKMHSPCFRPGWTVVQVLYTPEEAARREQDERRLADAVHALRPQIEAFLRTAEGEKRFLSEVKTVKASLRDSLRALEQRLAKTRSKWRTLARQLDAETKREERAARRSAKAREPPAERTVGELKQRAERREKAARLEQSAKEMAEELARGRERLGFGYLSFMDDVVARLLERVGAEVTAELVRQQREKAVRLGWRRPWDGPGGRDFEAFKALASRGPVDDSRPTPSEQGEGSDNSELSDVVFEGYEDLVGDADGSGGGAGGVAEAEAEAEEAEAAAQRAALLATLDVSDVSSDSESAGGEGESQDSEL